MNKIRFDTHIVKTIINNQQSTSIDKRSYNTRKEVGFMSKKDRVLISILATMMLNTSTFSLFASADNTADNNSSNSVAQNGASSSEEAGEHIFDIQLADEEESDSETSDISADDSDVTEVTDHSWGSWTVEKESTITEAGSKIRTCSKCGKIERSAAEKQSLRICGSNRFDTAFEAAEQIKKENGGKKFDSIVIACGSDFADALSASYLAKVTNAPILLYGKAVSDQMIDFLKKNADSSASIYIVGGSGAVSEDFEKTLKSSFKGKDQVKRLFGANRFGTNYEVLKQAQKLEKDSDGEILIASGINYADALSASAVGKPVLLVAGKKLTAEQKAYLEAFKGKKATIIGGSGAVSEEIEKELKGYVSKTERLSGSNRFETSYLVANKYFSNPSTVVLSYGLNYPDGLSGGPLALRYNSPLLLVSNAQTEYANKFVAETVKNGDDMVSGTVTLGGETLISDDAIKSIITDELIKTGLVATPVNTAILISKQPQDWSGKPGETADFEIEATGKNIKYQWQSSVDGKTWNDLSGKTAAKLTVSAALSLNGTMYRCVAASPCGEIVISNTAVITVATLSVDVQPESWSSAANSDAYFFAQGSKEDLDYLWQYSTDNGKTWKSTNVKTQEYNVKVSKTNSGRLVRCLMTDTATGEKITTNPVKLSECKDFKVVKQPAQQKTEIGGTQRIAAQVGGEDLTFQWQISTDGKSGWTNISGSNAKTACMNQKLTPAVSGKYVRCVVKDKNGKTVNTKAVQLVSKQTGFVEYAGKKYYIQSDSTTAKGLKKIGNASYYFSSAGEMLTGLRTISSNLYLFDSESGKMKTGVNKVDQSVYCFGTDGKAVSGWYTASNGDKYYFESKTKTAVTGFKTIDSKECYFNSDGVKTTGVILDSKGKYKYIADTPVRGKFVTFNGAKYYIDKNGYALTGLQKISGSTYYFGKNAVMLTGGYLINGKRYYFDYNTGKAITGIKERENGKKYYYNGANGVGTGLKKVGSDLYLFNDEGIMLFGPREYGGKYYYFDQQTGKAISGWKELVATSGNSYMYYYSKDDHAAVTGLQKIGSDYYFFNSDGAMCGGIREVNGKSLLFDNATGKLQTGWYNNGTYTFYYDGLNGRISGNKCVKIGEKYYYFSSNGPIVSGLKTVDNKILYFDPVDYSLVTGFININGKVYYSDGLNGLKSGYVSIDGNYYLFSDNGSARRVGAQSVNDKSYWFDENTGIRVTGIQYNQSNNKYYFYDKNGKQTGFTYYGGVLYNLNQSGVPSSGSFGENSNPYGFKVYFDSDTGEQQLGLITFTSSSGKETTYYYQKEGCINTGIDDIKTMLERAKTASGWNTVEGLDYYVQNGQFVKGIKEIDGKKYYFSELSGAKLEGLRRIGSDFYYFAGSDGSMLTGWQTIDGKKFYFDKSNGKMLTGLQTISSKKYCLLQGGGYAVGTVMIDKDIYLFASDGTGTKNNPSPGKMPSSSSKANSWGTYDGAKCYYDQNGKRLTGLQLIDRNLYLFDKSGKMLTGLQENGGVLRCYTEKGILLGLQTINGKLYYFDSFGEALKSQVKVIDGKTYFFTADGSAATGFCYVPEYLCTYYFDKDHTAHTGWLSLNGKKYYFYEKAELYPAGTPAHGITYIGKQTAYFDYETAEQKTGLVKVSLDKYMYFDPKTGYAASGLKTINGSLYLFSSQKESFGVSASGLETINKDTYYFDPDTQKAVTGFVTISQSTYYFGSDFKQVKGLQKIGSDLYYFNEKNGYMLTGLFRINGKYYYFNDEGKAITGWYTTDNGEKMYFSKTDHTAYTGIQTISGEKYFFSDKAKLKTGLIKDSSGKYHYLVNEGKASGFIEYNGNTYYVDSLGNVLTGLQKISGSYYYFNDNGIMITGAYAVNGKYCFFDDEGKAVTGFVKRENGNTFYYNGINGVKTGLQKINNKLYYLSDSGVILYGMRTIGNKSYFFDPQTGEAQSGMKTYVTSIGVVYLSYYSPDNYTAVTGLKKIDGAYYYFSERGNALSGKQKINNITVYFDPNTFKLYTGFISINGKVYYSNGLKGLTLDNNAKAPAKANSWGTINGVKCYYGQNGKVLTGSQIIDKKLYMFDENGKLMTGFVKQNGTTRYYTENGILTGLQKIGSSYYYFSPVDGSMLTGLSSISGKEYFFDDNGKRTEGWVSYDGTHKCYISNSKGVLTGLQEIGGKKYWFGKNGVMRTGVITITDSNNKSMICLFDDDGAMVHGLVERFGNLYYYNETTGERVTGWKTVNGKKYYFNPSGGAALKGRQSISNFNYYFDTETGEKKTGLIWYKGHLYYFDDKSKDGLTYGLTKINGELYYFIENSGYAKTGFLNLNDVFYYFSEETGQAVEGIHWANKSSAFYFEKTGGVRKGLVTFEGKQYYCSPSTSIVSTGLTSIGDKLYCFADSGEMMKNTIVIKGGIKYSIDDNGYVSVIGDGMIEKMIRSGIEKLGTPYLDESVELDDSIDPTSGFTCSRFVTKMLSDIDIMVPGTAFRQQHILSHSGNYDYEYVESYHDLKPGDLVYLMNPSCNKGTDCVFFNHIHHVMIYIGDGKMMHSVGDGVCISEYSDSETWFTYNIIRLKEK